MSFFVYSYMFDLFCLPIRLASISLHYWHLFWQLDLFFADKLAFYDVAAFIWTLGYVVLEAQLMIQLSSTIQLDSIKLSSTFNLNSVKKKISCLLADAYLNIQFFSHLLLLLGMIIKVSFKLISETFLGNGSGLFESR